MEHDSVSHAGARLEGLIRALIAIAAVIASAALWWPPAAHAARIKEIASV